MPPDAPPVAAAAAASSSVAVEDYLERIGELIRTKGYARVADIARALGVREASVSNMVRRLDEEGLLIYEKYRGLVLTAPGEALADNVSRRHARLADFLTLLGLPPDIVHHDVEGMEHHVSPETLAAVERLTANLRAHPEVLQRLKDEG